MMPIQMGTVNSDDDGDCDGDSNGVGNGEAAKTATDNTQPCVVARDDKLINEFVENEELLLGAFPTLFPSGRELKGLKGSLPQSWSRHLLRFHDGRFGRSHRFIFTLYNQLQRHSAVRAVAARVKANPQNLMVVMKFFDQPDCHEVRPFPLPFLTNHTQTRSWWKKL